MLKASAFACLATIAIFLCGCSQVGLPGQLPPANIRAQSKLQFAVGTANMAGQVGLNTLETFRQTNGASAVAVNAPTIVGPAGFVVPTNANVPSQDAGTDHISGQLETNQQATPPPSTFQYGGGAFGYGFLPANLGQNGNPLGNAQAYPLPFYVDPSTQIQYVGGPPAWPQVRNGLYPGGFLGYSQGFVDFAATPVAGTYTLNVIVPTGPTTTTTFSSTATLSNLTPLPAFSTPALTVDANGDGGATIAVTVPPGVTEAFINVENQTGGCDAVTTSPPYFYTIETTTTGAQVLTLPGNLGAPSVGAGGALVPSPTICSSADNAASGRASGGDTYVVYAVGVDYPLFEGAYPESKMQMPPIAGASGQADITASPVSAPTQAP